MSAIRTPTEAPPPVDVGDEASVARLRDRVRAEQNNLLNDVRQALEAPWGRRLLRHLMFDSEFGAMFDDVSNMPYPQINSAAGAQRVGLRIKDLIERAESGGFFRVLAEGVDGEG